jgi:hypothetical protein
MTIADKHMLLLRAIQCYVDTTACNSVGDDVDYKAVIASYAKVAPAIQALMLEVTDAVQNVPYSVMVEIEALGDE